MKIAVTYDNGQVFGHFGHTEEFKFYNVEDGKVASSEIVPTEGAGHETLVDFLKDNGVNVLICGGIGGGAKNALTAGGLEFYPGTSGNADDVVASFLAGKLDYDPDTTCSHHEHQHGEGHTCGHDHGEGHTCGHHH